MDFTGERYIPEEFGECDLISQTHIQRYKFAKDFVKGKKVIDIACGEGYGANSLATEASAVLGVDIDEGSINHALSRYTKENLSFSVGSVIKIPAEDASFDIVVSFETIEHVGLSDQNLFIKEVMRILKPEGIFIVSTPDKDIYGEGHNKFHIREMNKKGFYKQLTYYFPKVSLYGQDISIYRNAFYLSFIRIAHALIKLDTYRLRHKIFPKSFRLKVDTNLSKRALSKEDSFEKYKDLFPIKLEPNKTAMYLIAVCRK